MTYHDSLLSLDPPDQDRTNPRSERALTAVVLIIAIALLLVGCSLDPDPAGVGTHQQMNLPACGLLTGLGIPCATCGMTTAFSLAAHGRIVDALAIQPAGALLAIGSAAAAIACAYALLLGASLSPMVVWLWRPGLIWCSGGLVIVSWLYKIIVMTVLG